MQLDKITVDPDGAELSVDIDADAAWTTSKGDVERSLPATVASPTDFWLPRGRLYEVVSSIGDVEVHRETVPTSALVRPCLTLGETQSLVDAAGGSGGSGTSVAFAKTFAFDVSTLAALQAGVDTGIVLPAGSWASATISHLVTWNHSPNFGIDTTQANAVAMAAADSNLANGTDAADTGQNTAADNWFRPQARLTQDLRYRIGAEAHVWLAVDDAGAGDPTTGSSILLVEWIVPTV